MAVHYGYDPIYEYGMLGLLIGLVVTFASRGYLIFFLPGAINIRHLAASRLGEFRYYTNDWEWAKAGAMGPFLNILFAIALSPFRHNPFVRQLMVMTILFAAYSLNAFCAEVKVSTELSAQQAKELIAQHRNDPEFVILDVRTPAEYQQGHIGGAVLLDYYSPRFNQSLDILDRSRTYLIYCRSGSRSGRTSQKLAALGFTKVYDLAGGVLAWNSRKYPLVKK